MLYGFMKDSHIYNPIIKDFDSLDDAAKFLISRYKFTAKDKYGDRLKLELWEHLGTERKDMSFDEVGQIMKVAMGHDGDIWITTAYKIVAKFSYVKTRQGNDGQIIVLPFQKLSEIRPIRRDDI